MCENSVFSSPQTMKDAVAKEVTITTVNGLQHSGIIYTIDPLTKSIVLTDTTGTKLDIILYHAIKTLVLGETTHERFALTEEVEVMTPEASGEKKQKLIGWLKENCIEIIEDGVFLKISDYVTIEPPYDIEHCYCENTVVLERLQNIIKRMPD